jgi:hypothetical protein
LEFRVKSPGSTAAKIAWRRRPEEPALEAVGRFTDTLRYTVETPDHAEVVPVAERTLAKLRGRGMEVVEVRPRFDSRSERWALDRYKQEPNKLTMRDLGLVSDQARVTSDPQPIEAVRTAPAGMWVALRRFPPEKAAAARKWVSEVRRGRKRLASLGPLEARVERAADGWLEALARREADRALEESARALAEMAHGLQKDKVGRAYIDHSRRVAARLKAQGCSPEAVAFFGGRRRVLGRLRRRSGVSRRRRLRRCRGWRRRSCRSSVRCRRR